MYSGSAAEELHNRRLYKGYLDAVSTNTSLKSFFTVQLTSEETWLRESQQDCNTGLTADCTRLDIKVSSYIEYAKNKHYS